MQLFIYAASEHTLKNDTDPELTAYVLKDLWHILQSVAELRCLPRYVKDS